MATLRPDIPFDFESSHMISARRRCETYESVDLAWLSRSGKFDDRTPRTWKYSGGGLEITAYPGPWAVEFHTEGHIHRIALTHTETRFGGRRPWFACPHCQKRRRVLHYVRKSFACRECLDLRYSSQIEDPLSRAARQRRRLIEKVGGYDPGRDFPVKPKGMHWKTYRALEAKAHAHLRAFAIGVARLPSQGAGSP